MNRHRELTSRLRRHVPGALDAPAFAWSTPSAGATAPGGDGPLTRLRSRIAGRRRMAELAQIVAHLAVLVDADRRLPTGVAWIAAHGRGAVAGELAVVAGWMRDGMSATVALRRWASTSGCDGAARLAAVASGPIHQLAYGLRDLARDLERRVHDDQMAVLHLVAHVVWAVTVVAVAVAVARA